MNPIDTILQGDVREVPRMLPDNYVQTIITSPPFFGLRDYGTGTWHGGSPDCDHSPKRLKSVQSSTLLGGKKTVGHSQGAFRDVCGKCGAVREDLQIGLEGSPEEYIQTLVGVFRELRRVLRDDGTVWLNLGDSYASQGGPEPAQSKWIVDGASNGQNGGNSRTPGNLKPKDLMMIPARVALALQADGWWLRAEIVWHKTNGLPESVKDRPTRSHEHIFLLSKQPTYYYDQDAIREPIKTESIKRQMRAVGEDHKNSNGAPGQAPHTMAQPRPNRNNATIFKQNGSKRGQTIPGQSKGTHREDREDTDYHPLGRNKRDVWVQSVASYEGAHFAVFPAGLIRPCVLAGCPPDGIVLDPFMGSGTVAEVCIEEGRRFLGIELNPDYIALAEKRIDDTRKRLLAGKEYVKRMTQLESGYQQVGMFDE